MNQAAWLAPLARAQANGVLAELGRPRQSQWAEHQFAHARLPDQRLLKRLIVLATDFAQPPTAAIPQAGGGLRNWAASWADAATAQPRPIAVRRGRQQLPALTAAWKKLGHHSGG